MQTGQVDRDEFFTMKVKYYEDNHEPVSDNFWVVKCAPQLSTLHVLHS